TAVPAEGYQRERQGGCAHQDRPRARIVAVSYFHKINVGCDICREIIAWPMLYFARWRFHYKSLPSKIMARVSRHKRGRPPKFGRPSRLVALTLPTQVIRGLRKLHPDLAWAIVA